MKAENMNSVYYSGIYREIFEDFKKKLSGTMVVVTKGFRGKWIIVDWPADQDEKIKEALWTAEQLHSAYKNQREKFDADWIKCELDLEGCMYFEDDWVEILERA